MDGRLLDFGLVRDPEIVALDWSMDLNGFKCYGIRN